MALKFNKLTPIKIRKLHNGRKITEHGIIFERLANGDGNYEINVMVDGERIHRVIGRESEGVTRTQAQNYIEQVKTDSRKDRLNLPKGRKLVLGFKDAADRYLLRLKEEGGKDLKMKNMRLKQNLIPFFKNKPLTGICSFHIEQFKKARFESGRKPGTVNRDFAVLSHLFNKAVEWKWIEHKPAVIKRMKENSGRITYLTLGQMESLLDAAKYDSNPHIYPFIKIGLDTGMRRMEILSIRIENIDLGRKIIYIPQAKAGSREQPLTNKLVGYLACLVKSKKSTQGWLFLAKSKTGHTVAIEKPFRRVVAAAGLNPKEVNRHTLRHTAITHLVQAGIDLPTVKRISGHKTLAMVEKYSHQNGAHIQAAMDKLEERYGVS
jgi:integrase